MKCCFCVFRSSIASQYVVCFLLFCVGFSSCHGLFRFVSLQTSEHWLVVFFFICDPPCPLCGLPHRGNMWSRLGIDDFRRGGTEVKFSKVKYVKVE